MINQTIHGYTITKLLGSGGMSDVYLAENKLGKKAAIKVLKPELNAFPEVRDRFEQEARIMVGLEHRHIRQAYDLGDVDGRPAMIMEYLEGQTLKDAIAIGKLSESKARKYFEQCVEALRVTHEKGIVHRDIKPSNIFITRDDDIKIMDFGIAKVRETDLGTRTQQMLGTPVYMSPEQIRSPRIVTTQSDVYSLAVTFYHALTGRAPYDSTTDSDFEIQRKIVFEELDLSILSPNWQNMFRPMLVKDPQKRTPINELGTKNEDATIYDPGTTVHPVQPEGKGRRSWNYFLIRAGLAAGLLLGSYLLYSIFCIHDKLEIFIDKGLYGFKDHNGKVVIQPEYDYADRFSDGMARFRLNGKWGYINQKGQVVIPPEYDEAWSFSEGLGGAIKNDKYGFLDKHGHVAIPFYFDNMRSTEQVGYAREHGMLSGVIKLDDKWFFSGKLAPVKIGEKFGYTDQNGKIAIPLKYDYASSFMDNLALVELNGKRGFVDREGKETVPLKYSYAEDFHMGLAKVGINGKMGYINTKGKAVVPLIYDQIDDFSEGLARVELKGKYGFVDMDGKVAIPLSYDFAERFSEGLARVERDGQCGFIDPNGKEIIPLTFDMVGSFSEGLAPVRLNGKWGFIDKTGKIVIPTIYDSVYGFSSGYGLSNIESNGKFGYVDKSGNMAIPAIYEDASSFTEGLAPVKLYGKYGFIDNLGNVVIPFLFEDALLFKEGVAEVKLNNQWILINKRGKCIGFCD